MWELALSSLGGSLLNSLFTDENMWNEFGLKTQGKINWERQQEVNNTNWLHQKQLNEMNIKNAWDMWNASNAYNTPAAQMQRFKDAGLNPNLIYGQTNTTSPVSIPSAVNSEFKSYNGKGENLKAFTDMISQLPMVKEKYKILKEEARQAAIDTDIKAQNLNYLNMQYYKHALDNMKWSGLFNSDSYLNAWLKSEIEATKSNKLKNDLFGVQRALYEANKDFKRAQLKWYDSDPLTGSKGIWELQRDFQGTINAIRDMDKKYSEAMDFTKVANPWVRDILGFLKALILRR